MRIDLGGYAVFAQVTGGGSPPVLLVAQIGTPGSSWEPVTKLLTTGPQLVTYDRPGIGASLPYRPATGRRSPLAPVPRGRGSTRVEGKPEPAG